MLTMLIGAKSTRRAPNRLVDTKNELPEAKNDFCGFKIDYQLPKIKTQWPKTTLIGINSTLEC